MPLFQRKIDPDTPAGAVAHFLKVDRSDVVQAWSGNRKHLESEIVASWTGRSRAERLHDLKGAYRFFLTLTDSGRRAVSDLPDGIMAMALLSGAKSRILGFLWERTYGESMQNLAASWTAYSDQEMAEMTGRTSNGASDLGGFTVAAERLAAAVNQTTDEEVQKADKALLGAAARAGARVAEKAAAGTLNGDTGPFSSSDLPSVFHSVESGGSDDDRTATVATLGYYFVLNFIAPHMPAIAHQSEDWALHIGHQLGAGGLEPEWWTDCYNAYEAMKGDKGEPGAFYTRWSSGVLRSTGLDEGEALGHGLTASLVLPAACLEEMEGFKTELRGAGLMR